MDESTYIKPVLAVTILIEDEKKSRSKMNFFLPSFWLGNADWPIGDYLNYLASQLDPIIKGKIISISYTASLNLTAFGLTLKPDALPNSDVEEIITAMLPIVAIDGSLIGRNMRHTIPTFDHSRFPPGVTETSWYTGGIGLDVNSYFEYLTYAIESPVETVYSIVDSRAFRVGIGKNFPIYKGFRPK